MEKLKKSLLYALFALLFASLLLSPSYHSSAQEKTYKITETELTQLETNLEVLKKHNELRGINRVEKSETAVTNSQERIGSSERTNREIASVERADAEIIAECEQILARVRKRATTEN